VSGYDDLRLGAPDAAAVGNQADGAWFETAPSNDAPDGTGSDVAPDATDDASAIETAADGATDGAIDGTDADAVGPAVFSCAGSTANFCADFDDPFRVEHGFDWLALTTGNVVALDGRDRSPGTNALLVSLTKASNAYYGRAFDKPRATSTIEVDLDLAIDALPGSDTNVVKLQHGGDGYGFGILARSDGPGLLLFGPSNYDVVPIPGISAGRWVHVRIVGALVPTSTSVSVFLDRATTPVLTRSGVTAGVSANRVEFLIGLYAGAVTTTATVRYDNVELRMRD
jgi:hypothetical protein